MHCNARYDLRICFPHIGFVNRHILADISSRLQRSKDGKKRKSFPSTSLKASLLIESCEHINQVSDYHRLYPWQQFRPGPRLSMPSSDMRFDQTGHWPVMRTNAHCKNGNCHATTQTACHKCNVHLCLTKRHCFAQFHGVSLD